MTKPVLVDTDALVDFLRGHSKAVALVHAQSARIILSSIVAAELYAGVRGDGELITLDSLIQLFRVVPVSPGLARAAGLYKRDYAKSHGVGLADAIIAATGPSRERRSEHPEHQALPHDQGAEAGLHKDIRRPTRRSGRRLTARLNARSWAATRRRSAQMSPAWYVG